MTWIDLVDGFWGGLRYLLWKFFPKPSLLWRNGSLWHVAAFRWSVCLLVCGVSALFIFLLQHLLHQSGLWVSPVVRYTETMDAVQELKSQAQTVQIEGAARALLVSQKKVALDKLNAQHDNLLAQWPNSALRMPLLSQLQVLALKLGLKVIELKTQPSPNVLGFESSRIHFQMKGSKQATYVYWQNIDRVFVNGIWPSLSWVLQADGQYVLSAQLHLLWDMDDAFTDTGVEVRWHDALVPKLDLGAAHVFPEQSQAEMRLVGWGFSDASVSQALPKMKQTTWALVKAGPQVLPVQSGQYLGQERAQILFANEQGLWGVVDDGLVQKLLAWEVPKP